MSMNNINKNIIELFHDFLETIDNYFFSHCSKYFNKIIKTHHVKQYILKKTQIKNKFTQSNKTSQDIAELIYSLYKLKYTLYDKVIYIFENHKWNGSVSLKKLIRRTIIENANTEYHSYYNVHLIITENNEIEINFSEIKQLLFNILEKNIEYNKQNFNQLTLKESNKIVSLNTANANKELFVNNLEKNTHLICFKNGVYDLINDIFRIGFPEDYILKFIKYDYKKKYFNKDMLLNFLQEIQPDETIRNKLLEETAECLNCKKVKVLIFYGNSNNISAYINLIGNTFDAYFKEINNYEISDVIYNIDLWHRRVVIATDCIKIGKKCYNNLFNDNATYNIMYTPNYITTKKKYKMIFQFENKPEFKEISRRAEKRTCFINFPDSILGRIKYLDYNYYKNDFMLLLIDIYKKKYLNK